MVKDVISVIWSGGAERRMPEQNYQKAKSVRGAKKPTFGLSGGYKAWILENAKKKSARQERGHGGKRKRAVGCQGKD